MSPPNPSVIECEICGADPDAFSDQGKRPLCAKCRLETARAAGVDPLPAAARKPYNRNCITNDLDNLRSQIEYMRETSVGYLSNHVDHTLEFIGMMREPWLNIWDKRDALVAALKLIKESQQSNECREIAEAALKQEGAL